MTDRTALTEIVTGLGMLGEDLRGQLPVRPGELRNVDDATWDGLVDGWNDTDLTVLADQAFANGRAFFEAVDGSAADGLGTWSGPADSVHRATKWRRSTSASTTCTW